MKTMRLRYVTEDVDRHGNVRIYFRKPGARKVRLRGPVGSPAFFDDYRAAAAGKLLPKAPAAMLATVEQGTLGWVCLSYFQCAEFKKLDARTQRVRRQILQRLIDKEGQKPFAKMRAPHIRKRRDLLADKPEAANGMLKALRQVYKHAIREEFVDANYAAMVEYITTGSEGFHAWNLDEVAAFEAVHPVGSKARLALALLLYTGQRREDVTLFGKQHVRDEWLIFRQHKNRKRKPVDLEIPIVPELRTIIEASPCGDLAFLTSSTGRPFASGASFYNSFKKWCVEAGLPHCAPHGLRKAAASRLAELGCTESEIMSITGHRTSKEITRYTKAARQRVMARSAMDKLEASHQTAVVPRDSTVSAGGDVPRSNVLKRKAT